MERPKFTSILGVALDILQILFATAVVILVSWKLTNVDINIVGLDFNAQCLLDGSDGEPPFSGVRFCIYAAAVGVISLIVNVIFNCIIKFFKCITLNACFASNVLAIAGDIALAIWWGVAFALFVVRGTKANNLDWPERTARDGVIGCAFGALAAFAADAIVTIVGIAMS